MDFYVLDWIKVLIYATPLTIMKALFKAFPLSLEGIQRTTNGAVTRHGQQCFTFNIQHFEDLL